MSVLEDRGGRKELRERGRDEGKGKGRREQGRGEGRGGEGRQPVAHDHQITSSYSTSLVPVHRWSRVKPGSSRSISYFPSCVLLSAFGKLTAAKEVIQERSEYCDFSVTIFTYSNFRSLVQ